MKCRYCPAEVPSDRAAKGIKSCAKCAKAARRKEVREPPVVLKVSPVMPAAKPRELTLIEMADRIIKSGPGFVGCNEEDEE